MSKVEQEIVPRTSSIGQTPSMFPSSDEWTALKDQAATIIKSGLLPSTIKTPEAAIAIALKGRELGIPMMQSFSHIHIVNGKPGMSAELMLGLIFKLCPESVVEYDKSDATECIISAARPRRKATKFSFTIDEARRAGLTNKDVWKNYPAAMLRARAIASMARALFPDCLQGCSHTPEELGADVDAHGAPIAGSNDSTNRAAKLNSMLNDETPPAATKPPIVLPKEEPKQEPKQEMSRIELGKAINVAAKKLGVNAQEYCHALFGVDTKDISMLQMHQMLTSLERDFQEKS